MKIDQTGSARATTARRGVEKAGKARSSGFARELEQATGADEVRAPQTVAKVEALIAVQEVSDQGGGRARQRGNDMLDRLDEIRHGLLTGGLSRARLHELGDMVREKREDVSDHALAQILDEIELRARVELAKYDQQA
ncbi:MAG: flagellar assembly protein FliX [Alphaproteobacteria bacterium]|nr:flagellar assembly protein FliX [Alphaproteobacteria bacterium]